MAREANQRRAKLNGARRGKGSSGKLNNRTELPRRYGAVKMAAELSRYDTADPDYQHSSGEISPERLLLRRFLALCRHTRRCLLELTAHHRGGHNSLQYVGKTIGVDTLKRGSSYKTLTIAARYLNDQDSE